MISMRFAPLLLLALTGCPESVENAAPPPPVGDAANPGPGPANPPPGEAGAPAPDGAAPPADGSAPPPAEGAPGEPPAPPGFASLIQGGKSVKLSGTLQGAKTAKVEFAVAEKMGDALSPKVIEIVEAKNGTFSVEVPATYAEEIWVIASYDAKGDGPTPDDLAGAVAKPVKLAGADVSVAIELTSSPDWTKNLPWSNAADPNGGGAPGPGGGTPPENPPPPGAPAGGAPPAAPSAPAPQ